MSSEVAARPDAVEEPARGASTASRERPQRWWPTLRSWAGDGTAVLLLATVLVWLAAHDGGAERDALLWTAGVALVAAPAAAAEVRRLPRAGRWLLAAWGVGALVSVALAAERSGFVEPVLVHGLVPVVFLAASRIWRRPWGPAAVLAVLLVAVGRYWQRSYMQWWGYSLSGADGTWFALSWHNQSAVLMGAFAAVFAGAALLTRRLVSAGLVLAAGACLAGAWLTGSRGGILATLLGLVVVGAAAWAAHHRGRRAPGALAGRMVGIAVVAGLVVALLSGMAAGRQPLAEREQSAVGNGFARLRHMQAAVGMLADDPLTGQGLGSYRTRALPFTPPDANLTSSAHNEYLEALGEGGLLLGVPVLALAGLLGWQVLVSPRRRGDVVPDAAALRGPLGVGAAGLVAVVGAHSAIDFDWNFPVLPALLALGAAALLAERGVTGLPRRWRTAAAAAPAVLLLAVGLAGGIAEQRAGQASEPGQVVARAVPWNHVAHTEAALALLFGGDADGAEAAVARTRAWNGDVATVRISAAMVDYRQGELGPEGLVGVADDHPVAFRHHVLAARLLADDGHARLALEVLDRLDARLERHTGWGVGRSQVESALVRIPATAEVRGCAAARQVLRGVLDEPYVDGVDGARRVLRETTRGVCPEVA